MRLVLGQGKGLARRLTALAAIYVFLLAGALATHHQHGAAPACRGPVCHSGAPAAHPSDTKPCKTPGGCLACLWTRAAVVGPVAAGPAVFSSEDMTRPVPIDESGYRQVSSLTHLSRGPPPLPL